MKGYDRIRQDIEPEDSASGPYKSSERSLPSVISLISKSVTGGAAAGGTLPPTFLSFRPTIFVTPLTVVPLLLRGFQLPGLLCFVQLAYVPKALSHTLQTKVLIVGKHRCHARGRALQRSRTANSHESNTPLPW
jgi:hypothetical protein